MNSENNIINFNKILQVIVGRKKAIFVSFIAFCLLGTAIYFVLPRKYTTEAKILIKKTGSTNLSYINPFVVSESSDGEGINVLSFQNPLNEEIEIIKSSLVISNVVKENGLRYKTGPAKGKYLSTKDFLKKNFTISKIRDTNIIYVSYKSGKPLLSYNVVNSVINNYKKIQKNLNLEKSANDTVFLKDACIKAQKELNKKTEQLKQIKKNVKNAPLSQEINMLGHYDRRLRSKISEISRNEVDTNKLEAEIMQKTGELNQLKEKLEKSSLIRELSKNATDILVLESGQIKENYDFSEPQPLVVFIFCIFGWSIFCLYLYRPQN